MPEDVLQAVLIAGRAAGTAQRQAMESATVESLARLQEMGTLEFSEVDVSLFQARVQDVYRNHAAKLGGIEVIDAILRY